MRRVVSLVVLSLVLLALTASLVSAALPVIQQVEIARGPAHAAVGPVVYYQHITVTVSDADGAGDIGWIWFSGAGSWGGCIPVCEGQDRYAEDATTFVGEYWAFGLEPPPVGEYTVTVYDNADPPNTAELTTVAALPVSETEPEVLLFPAIGSVLVPPADPTNGPVFQWTSTIPDCTYRVRVDEEGLLPGRIWQANVASAYPAAYTEVAYNVDDAALRETLQLGYAYFWRVEALAPADPPDNTDPRVTFLDGQASFGRFAVYDENQPVPPVLPGSPNQKLAYPAHSSIPSTDGAIMLYTTDIGERLWLTPAASSLPAWSPDGTMLLYNWVGAAVIDSLDGSAPSPVPLPLGYPGDPQWAPDSGRIVFALGVGSPFIEPNYDVWVANIDGSGARAIADSPYHNERYPLWSPDGLWIAYRSLPEPDPEGFGTHLVRYDGTEDHALTATGLAGTEYEGCQVTSMIDPAWSPDGTELAVAFGALKPGGDPDNWDDYIGGIGRISRDGGLITPVHINPPGIWCCASSMLPWWSPDGTKIGFKSALHLPPDPEWALGKYEPDSELWVVNADGSGDLTRLTYDHSDHHRASWWAPNMTPGSGIVIAIGDVTVTFETVTGEGTTSIVVTTPPGVDGSLGEWDIATTASTSGLITVEIAYDESLLPPDREDEVRLLHYEGGSWVDITVLPVDTVNNIVRGECTSLGQFKLYFPDPVSQSPIIQDAEVWRDYHIWEEGNEAWEHSVTVWAHDLDGAEDIVSITTLDPDGELHPEYGVDRVEQDDESSTVRRLWWWERSETTPLPLAGGLYEVTATDLADNTDVVTSDFVPSPLTTAPVITYPPNHSTIAETLPLIQWQPYDPGTGQSVTAYWVQVERVSADEWVRWWVEVPPDTTSVQYNFDETALDPELIPGEVYHPAVFARLEAPPQSDPRIRVVDVAGSTHIALVATHTPDPVINSIGGGSSYFVRADGSEGWGRWVGGSGRDPLGNSNIASVVVTDPLGGDHVAATWDEGGWPESLRFEFYDQPLSPDVIAGTYTVTVTNDQGYSAVGTMDMTVPPTTVPTVISPGNGEVLVDVTRPVFEWEPYPGADGYWVTVRQVGGAVVVDWFWVGSDVTQIECPVDLAPGEYEFEVVASVPGVGEAHRIISFLIYSPIPIIQQIDLDRGRDVEPNGTVGYHERMEVRVLDCDGVGHIESVTITDAAGVDHVLTQSTVPDDWWWREEGLYTLALYWDQWGSATPPPPNPYTVTVVDYATNSDAITTAAPPPVCELSPELLTPPPGNSLVYDATPTFSWIRGIPGSWDNLHMWHEATGQELWYYGTDTETSIVYGTGGSPPDPEPLIPGHTYGWQIDEWICDDCGVSDPRVFIRTAQHSLGRFTVGWGLPTSVGTDVSVSVEAITITFDAILTAGMTTIGLDSDPPGLPSGYVSISDYYEASTTAIPSGPVTVCMSYTDAELFGLGPEESLVLLRYDQGSEQWQDITTSRDPEANTVCGQADSLGLFVLAATPEPVPIEGRLLVDGYWMIQGTSNNVTPLEAGFIQGQISPLGDRIAYVAGPQHQWQWDLWTADLDGSAAVNLTEVSRQAGIDLQGINCSPVWSPDGTQIAFQHCDPIPGLLPCEAGFYSWVTDADGGNARLVVADASGWIAGWTPDGYRLVIGRDDGVYLMDLDGTDEEKLPVTGCCPRISPDGSRFAVVVRYPESSPEGPGERRTLEIVDIDGSNRQVLVERFITDADVMAHLEHVGLPLDWYHIGDVQVWVGPAAPVWSPNGDRVAFVMAYPFDPLGACYNPQKDLWIYDLTASDVANITEGSEMCGLWAVSWNGENTSPESPTVTVGNTTVSFEGVTSDGVTTIIRDDEPPGETPEGFTFLGDYYNIETTAEISGVITIEIHYEDEDVPGGQEEWLSLMHWEVDHWVDITVRPIDTVNNIITGECYSLSEFGIAFGPQFVGLLEPINNDGSSIFKLNRTVPVKFQLKNADGSFMTDAVAKLYVAKVTDQVVGTYEEPESTSAADTGNTFRYDVDADQYIFNLGTKGLSTGTWVLQVTVNGVVMKEVWISLR